jgi:protein-S-isoprenylcysteine O-methyltransferase Ste14
MLIGLAGCGLLANAGLVVPSLVLHGCWRVLLPLAEEPWLREAFGDEFERYCEEVPRFVGVQTFERT